MAAKNTSFEQFFFFFVYQAPQNSLQYASKSPLPLHRTPSPTTCFLSLRAYHSKRMGFIYLKIGNGHTWVCITLLKRERERERERVIYANLNHIIATSKNGVASR